MALRACLYHLDAVLICPVPIALPMPRNMRLVRPINTILGENIYVKKQNENIPKEDSPMKENDNRLSLGIERTNVLAESGMVINGLMSMSDLKYS
jgi:hypothetical protein